MYIQYIQGLFQSRLGTADQPLKAAWRNVQCLLQEPLSYSVAEHVQVGGTVTTKLTVLESYLTERNAMQSFDRHTAVHELLVAFKIPYVCEYVTKLCRTQAEVIRYHVNPNVRGSGQVEAMHMKYKRLKLGGGQAYGRSAD
jgi:hypothetical protein